jgi:hypothetical protein
MKQNTILYSSLKLATYAILFAIGIMLFDNIVAGNWTLSYKAIALALLNGLIVAVVIRLFPMVKRWFVKWYWKE